MVVNNIRPQFKYQDKESLRQTSTQNQFVLKKTPLREIHVQQLVLNISVVVIGKLHVYWYNLFFRYTLKSETCICSFCFVLFDLLLLYMCNILVGYKDVIQEKRT